MSNKEKMYQNAAEKSIAANIKFVRIPKKVLRNRLVATFALGAITAILVTSTAKLGYQNIEQNQILNEELKVYEEIVTENTHRTNDNQNYYYDPSDIARRIIERGPDELDEGVYGVWESIGYNKEATMDDVIRVLKANLSDKDFSGSFEDYVLSLGFDKEGKADYEGYKAYMEELIIAKNKVEQVETKKR